MPNDIVNNTCNSISMSPGIVKDYLEISELPTDMLNSLDGKTKGVFLNIAQTIKAENKVIEMKRKAEEIRNNKLLAAKELKDKEDKEAYENRTDEQKEMDWNKQNISNIPDSLGEYSNSKDENKTIGINNTESDFLIKEQKIVNDAIKTAMENDITSKELNDRLNVSKQAPHKLKAKVITDNEVFVEVKKFVDRDSMMDEDFVEKTVEAAMRREDSVEKKIDANETPDLERDEKIDNRINVRFNKIVKSLNTIIEFNVELVDEMSEAQQIELYDTMHKANIMLPMKKEQVKKIMED